MSMLTEFMTHDPRTAGPALTLVEACRKMKESRSSYLIIEEKGLPIGILTEADIARKAIPDGLNLATTQVKDLMSKPVATIEPTRTMEEVNTIMKTRGFRHLVVVEGQKIVGMVTLLGLLRYFEQKSQK